MYRTLIALAVLVACHFHTVYSQSYNNYSQNSRQALSVPLPVQTLNLPSANASNIYDKHSLDQFRKKYGSWYFSFDPSTGCIHRAWGDAIKIKGFDNINAANVREAALAFLRENEKFLKINLNDLKFVRAREVNNRFYVSFIQTYKGLDVLLSEIELRIFTNGNVMAFGSEFYNGIDLSVNPTITASQASEIALSGLNFNEKSDRLLSTGSKFILPVKTGKSVSYKLVYRVDAMKSHPLSNFVTYVDAHRGVIAWRFDKVLDASADVDVKGTIRMKNPKDPLVEMPFPNQLIVVDGKRYHTGKDGKVSIDINGPTANYTVKMNGIWVYITLADSIHNAKMTGTLQPGDNILNWNDNNSDKIERILYCHTNYIHDYFARLDTGFKGMDFPMPVTIMYEKDPQLGTNACSMGRELAFFGAADPEMRLAECPSVLYHEYGHSVNAILYEEQGKQDGMINSSANEGLADLTSALVLDDPEISKGVFPDTSSRKNLRCVKNNNVYPDSLSGDPHFNGLILAGAFWDLREKTSLALVEKLSHFAKYGTPDDPQIEKAYNEWFLETLITDDDNGNLADGTPHFKEILESFNAHRIGTNLFILNSFAHEKLPDTQDLIHPYKAYFRLESSTLPGCAIDSVRLCYSLDKFQTSSMVDAKPSDITGDYNYMAEIPPAPRGSVIRYYFTAFDPALKCNLRLSQNISYFKPYEFLVGYKTALKDDCESRGAWTIGSPSDMATHGKWENGDPDVVALVFMDGDSEIIQPGDDHTPEGSRCFVTGPRGSVSDIFREPEYNENAPNGSTTLYSPDYFIGNLEKPLLVFYRWRFFFVRDYGDPFPTWQTELSTNGGSSWIQADSLVYCTVGWEKVTFYINEFFGFMPQTLKFRIVVNVTRDSTGSLHTVSENLLDDVQILTANDAALPVEEFPSPIGDNSVRVYPNPFTSETVMDINCMNDISGAELRVFDLLGNSRKIISGINTRRIRLHRDGLEPGMYFYRLTGKDGIIAQGRLIVGY